MLASRSLPGLLVVAALFVGAGCSSARLSAWPVEPENPTSWTFDIRKDDARTLILDSFCTEEDPLWAPWRVRADDDVIRLRAFLGRPDYLSPVYHSARGPCPLIVSFQIQLSAPSPERTTVRVVSEDLSVVAGMTSGFLRVHGPSRIVKPAQPTTVEEYTILRRCGAAFGVRDMPKTTIPHEGVEAITARLLDTDFDVAETLTFLGGPQITARLIGALGGDPKRAAQAAYVLGRLRATEAVPALERASRSTDWDVQEAANYALRVIRGKEPSVDDLLAQLMSRAASDRLDAAIALVSTGREVDRARPVLQPFRQSKIVSERWRAEAALVRLRRTRTQQ